MSTVLSITLILRSKLHQTIKLFFTMPLDEVKDILLKYKKEESRINELLQQRCSDAENCTSKSYELNNKRHLTAEEVVQRNKMILKDLETVKGNLRSKAIYSPSEMQWDDICKKYQSAPSLPVTSWRCHVSVFV